MKTRTAILLGLLSCGAGYLLGMAVTGKKLMRKVDGTRFDLEKSRHFEQTYDFWMMAKKYGTPIEKYLLDKGIRRVVIYGTTEFGVRLYHELKDTEVEVLYALDRNPKYRIPGLRIYTWGDYKEVPPEEEKASADAVIVATFLSYDSVAPALENAGYQNIIALDGLLCDLMKGGDGR